MVQKIEFKNRFNPDGECRSVALDFITNYFFNQVFDSNLIANIKTFNDIIKFIRSHGLQYHIKLPTISFLSPTIWPYFLFHFDALHAAKTFKRKQIELKNRKIRHCVLYRLSPALLYDISESWTHCVVKYYDGDQDYFIYDPLTKIYPNIQHKIKKNELDNVIARCLLIW